MLVVYKEEKCTSILNTSNVKQILSKEAKLTEAFIPSPSVIL